MSQALIIPWPEDVEEVIFASDTSLISPEMLI